MIKAYNFEYKYFNICRIILDQDPPRIVSATSINCGFKYMTIKLKINKRELSLIKYYKFVCVLILKYYNLIMVYGT